jgi:hypothetical protein
MTPKKTSATTRVRAALVGLLAVAVVAVPGVAVGSTGGFSLAGAHPTQHSTAIHFLDFAHMRGSGIQTNIFGQVIGHEGGQHGALAGVTVTLDRRLVGTTSWIHQATDTTDTGTAPVFHFVVLTRQNADYRVTFAGTTDFAPSTATTWIEIYRFFNATIHPGGSTATLSGHVFPYYTHKPVALQKATCATCGFTTVKTISSGIDGTYSFALPAPGTGSWYWRVIAPKTDSFVRSYSGTYSSHLN